LHCSISITGNTGNTGNQISRTFLFAMMLIIYFFSLLMIFISIVVDFIKFLLLWKLLVCHQNLKKLSVINDLYNTALLEFISVF